MDNSPEDKLQLALEQHEQGQTPPASTNGREDETASLSMLAAKLKSAKLPTPNPAATARQREQLVQQARRQPEPFTAPRGGRLATFGSLFAVLLFMCMGVSMLGAVGSLWFMNRSAPSATLAELSGTVEISSVAQPQLWRALADGDTVRTGQQLRTGPNSGATLEFSNGSMVQIGANTTLEFTQIAAGPQIDLTVLAGETYHWVNARTDGALFYRVHTPAGVASVHGTSFAVNVAANGRTQFALDSGALAVEAAGTTVMLTPGTATLSNPGEMPSEPSYRFSAQGELTAITGDTWVVGQLSFLVDDNTLIDGDLQVGDLVYVEGRILTDGSRLADLIKGLPEGDTQVTFTGPLEAMSDVRWIVGGTSVAVSDSTQLLGEFAIGDIVRVVALVGNDGVLRAILIENLSDEDDTPDPEPTPEPTDDADPEPDPAAQPSLDFEPDELLALACQLTVVVVGTLTNTGTPPNDVALNVVLGYEIVRGEEFVESVALQPAGWPEIAAGSTVRYMVMVALNEDLLATAPAGSEVKVRVFIASEDNRPEQHPGRATVTIEFDCDEPTPEPSATSAPTPVPINTPVPPPAESDKVVLCHKPPGNPSNGQTIEVGRAAVDAHLAHGDTLGPCP